MKRLVAALSIVLAAAFFAANGRWPWRRLEPALAPLALPAPLRWSSDTLRAGQTLAELLGRQGVDGSLLVSIFERAGLDARRLRAGLIVQFRNDRGQGTGDGGQATSEISIRTGPEERLTASFAASGWSARREPITWRTDVIRVSGPIDNSLYDALDASIPDSLLAAENRVRLAWDLADIYAWSIDFTRDIQPGDRFAALVERRVSEEGEVRTGAILAAELVASGRQWNAFRFTPERGPAAFYDANGRSLRRAFLRAPLEFRRIASGFSRLRFHPILGIWRRHEGTDYSAAAGTPVLAAGEGTVLRAGWGGGYGNLVELRHANGISTRYGHLRGLARGIRAGARVRQGQVIGYVGSSGLATGPHLHYEFRVNGLARDSRRVALPTGVSLAATERARFEAQRARLALALAGGGAAPALGDH